MQFVTNEPETDEYGTWQVQGNVRILVQPTAKFIQEQQAMKATEPDHTPDPLQQIVARIEHQEQEFAALRQELAQLRGE